MSRNKKKNIFNFVVSFFKGIFVELYKLIYNMFLGIFSVFDIIVTTIFTIVSSIYYSFAFIFKYIYKAIKAFFKFIWKNIFLEGYEVIKDFFLGIYYIVKFFLYDIPKIIMGYIVKVVSAIYNKFKTTIELIKQFFNELPRGVKKYFIDKFNNLSIVKYYRNKKERELEVLYIDKNSEDAKRSEKKHAYQYLARNKEEKLVKGYFMALSKLDTHSYLLDEGFEVYEIKTSAWIDFIHGDSTFKKRRMKSKYLIFWLAQLSTYIKSGVTLTEAVKVLAKQNKNASYKKSFDSMIYELTMGESFSESLRKQGNLFPGLLVNMVKASEKMGDIEKTLDDMSIYYDQAEKNKRILISAMTYPLLILGFAVMVIAFILGYIIPQFVDVYASLGIQLNSYTQAIVDASDFVSQNWRYLIFGFIAIVISVRLLFIKVKAFRTAFQYIIMHIPVIGTIIIYKEMTMFSKTFAELNKNNVLLTESIDILGKITNNEIYKLIMFDTISNLLRGDKMSQSFKDNWAVPELAYYMISTGESTGELADMLERVSDYYQNQQENMVNQLKTFIEPIMIAFLAVVVGGIILAILIPMFQMYQSLG